MKVITRKVTSSRWTGVRLEVPHLDLPMAGIVLSQHGKAAKISESDDDIYKKERERLNWQNICLKP